MADQLDSTRSEDISSIIKLRDLRQVESIDPEVKNPVIDGMLDPQNPWKLHMN